ncbi:MAG TPA: DoxX family protein [Roseiarcus sp.]|nr:DoxX family protein [Roseiarcus sp.]
MRLASIFWRLAFAPLPSPPGFFALPLRLIVGYGFLQHGYAKLARGPEDFIAILHAMGMPFAFLLGWATIVTELVGGLLILGGAFVPLAAAPMIVVLLVATFTVHLPNGFSSIKLLSYDAAGAHFGQPGYETDLLYLAALLALCFGGAGPLSLDGYVSARRTADRRDETEPAPAEVKPPLSRDARPRSSPSPQPSETRRAPPTANTR